MNVVNKRKMTGKLRGFTNKIAYIWTANRVGESSKWLQLLLVHVLSIIAICSDL